MKNYIKSEYYRILRHMGIYIFTLSLSLLLVAFNIALRQFGLGQNILYPYDTISFSFSNLISTMIIFCIAGAIIAQLLYGDHKKNRSLKNTISFGVSRTKIILGQYLVATIVASLMMLVVLSCFIGSAILLLDQAPVEHNGIVLENLGVSGPVQIEDLLTGVVAVYFFAVAAMVLMIALSLKFENEFKNIISFFAIWFLIPRALYFLGFRVELARTIAMWFPVNIFAVENMTVNLTESITPWKTPESLLAITGIGFLTMLLCGSIGLFLVRDREI